MNPGPHGPEPCALPNCASPRLCGPVNSTGPAWGPFRVHALAGFRALSITREPALAGSCARARDLGSEEE